MLKRAHLRRFEIPGHARFLTCSCFRRLPLLATSFAKAELAANLEARRVEGDFRLLAWVIIPEHFHLILVPQTGLSASTILQRLKEPVARRILAQWKASDAPILSRVQDPRGRSHFWLRGGGYDRNLIAGPELDHKIEYIHANPVRRGLAARATEWTWSSACWYQGDQHGPVQIDLP